MIRLSNIERFATHDGPGIRTTLFFKGCHMHCPWCANPETWNFEIELLHDPKKCTQCARCQTVCQKQAIKIENGKWRLQKNQCDQCRKCEEACLNDAITFSGKEYSIEELQSIVAKDRDFYEESHGGITLSGGEVMLQLEEVKTLLKKLKQENYHIALETTGSYPLSSLKQVVEDVDLFLMDFKHLDLEKLEQITGANGAEVIENFQYLAKHYPEKVILRMPVIPRFNADRPTIEAVLDFAREYGIQEVDLLPFHPLGANKWQQLDRLYLYQEEPMMDKEQLKPYIELGKKKGVFVKVGG
ncbi:glycyl-radical enzyme activating protein [Dubosiella newyorkensis]|uniref:glycyl-radical enzyme activating protein n=1 Tax=Dubosiella newyorkensis TaxID=1862672 RepID=UPI00272CD27D|nr:glycyl-radical enzyme activating protein [Dubosiella newyorkensis]